MLTQTHRDRALAYLIQKAREERDRAKQGLRKVKALWRIIAQFEEQRESDSRADAISFDA